MSQEIRNAYQTLDLELSPDVGLPQVQKAYQEMLTVWDPDRFSHNPDLQRKAQERTKQIHTAYEVLKRYLKDGTTPCPSKQSQNQETASEDAHSSQTHEQENPKKRTTEPLKEKSLAAKIGAFLKFIWDVIMRSFIVIVSRRIVPIISGFFSGVLSGAFFFFALDLMIIKASRGWSPWDELGDRFFSIQIDIVSFIVTFFSRIIGTIPAKNQGKPSDISFKGWFIYTAVGVCFGGIGGIVLGLPVAWLWADKAIISHIAAFLGAVSVALLACRYLNKNERLWKGER